MKKSVLFFAMIVVFLAGFTIDSHADMRGKGRGGRMPMCNKMQGMGPGMCGCMAMSGERSMMGSMMGKGMMISNLGLDEKQTAEFRAIHVTMKKERIQKNAQINIAELELREVLDKDPVDMKTAEAKVKQIESLRAELKLLHIRTHEKVKAMLTPEQRKKFDSLMGTGMGRGMGMMENCRMMGSMTGMRQMDRMTQSDEDAMQDDEDMDDSDMPAEGHAH